MSQNAPVDLLPLFTQPAPPRETEAEKGRRILDALAEQRRGYLDRIRSQMRQLYLDRSALHGTGARVSPDDARAFFESLSPPAGLSRNFLAQVFREPGWTVVGSHVSTTKGSHGNDLKAYAWTGR